METTTAMRATEICNLRVGDLDLAQNTVRIARVKGSPATVQTLGQRERIALEKWLQIRKPDGPDDFVFASRKRSQRQICSTHPNGCPTNSLLAKLQQKAQNRLPRWLKSQKPCVDVRSDSSNRLNPATIYRLFAEIAARAGIPEHKGHPLVLKNTLAQLLYTAGEDILTIQKALGYKAISSVLVHSQSTGEEPSAAITRVGKRIL
jgi:integrase